MLVNLHVKNFAIIDEIDVDFSSGLNILTGETGAGKSNWGASSTTSATLSASRSVQEFRRKL